MNEPAEDRRSLSASSQAVKGQAPSARQGLAFLSNGDISAPLFKKCLMLLFVSGLVIRTLFLLEHAATPSFAVPTLDQVYYDTVAKMLLAGDDLHALHGFRPLLYPMFLACCYKVAGGWGPDLAIVLQHIIGVGTGLLVAILGARLFRNRVSGVVAGALYLLAPVPLYFEGELLIEPTYVFLIFLALWLHLQAAEKSGWKAASLWLSCGALLVLAAQARANIMVFLAIYPLFAAYHFFGPSLTCSRRESPISSSMGWALSSRGGLGSLHWLQAALPLVGLVGALVMAVPWGFFNLRQSDHFHLLPNAGGVALYCGNKRGADGMTPEQERRIYSGDRYQDSIETWAREDYESAMRAQGHEPDSDPMAISRYWTRKTLDEIRADPKAWLGLMGKKTWLAFWNAEIPNNKAFAFLQQDYFWLRVLPVRWVVLLALAPAGLWAAFRFGNRDALLILASYAALYSAANIVFFICDRYRYPVWPAAAIFAGGGLVTLFELIVSGLKQKQAMEMSAAGVPSALPLFASVGRSWSFRLALSLVGSACLMVAVSLPNWFNARLPSFSRDYLFRSIAWYERGHFREALDDINRSVALNPAEASALHHRGNVLFALNRLQEAEGAYEQALTLSPGEAGIWNNLAAALAGLGHSDEALNAYQRAIACSPPSKNAFVGAALLETRLGRLDEAAQTLARFDQFAPTPDPEALAIRAVLARKQGDLAKAENLERAARRLDPGAASWTMERASE